MSATHAIQFGARPSFAVVDGRAVALPKMPPKFRDELFEFAKRVPDGVCFVLDCNALGETRVAAVGQDLVEGLIELVGHRRVRPEGRQGLDDDLAQAEGDQRPGEVEAPRFGGVHRRAFLVVVGVK